MNGGVYIRRLRARFSGRERALIGSDCSGLIDPVILAPAGVGRNAPAANASVDVYRCIDIDFGIEE